MYVFKVRKSWREWHLWNVDSVDPSPLSIIPSPLRMWLAGLLCTVVQAVYCTIPELRLRGYWPLLRVYELSPLRGSVPLPIWSRVVITASPIAHTSHLPFLSTLCFLIKASQQTYPQFTAKDTEMQKVKVICPRSMICVTHLCSHDAEIFSCT